MKQKHIGALMVLVAFALVLAPAATVERSKAAGGTNGTLAGPTSAFLNTVVAIKCYDMDVSSDYGIDINDVSVHNWTNAADQTTKMIYESFESTQESDGQIKIELTNSGATVIDTLYITALEPEDFIDTDFATDLFTPLLVLGIFISVLIAIVGGSALAIRRARK